MADPRRARGDRGAGLFGLLGGFLVVLLLLVVAVHVAFGLYARSVVGGAASDAAREVAGFDNVEDRAAAARRATARLREAAAGLSPDLTVTWGGLDGDVVWLEVRGRTPGLVGGVVGGLAPVSIDRTISVRAEDRRP